MSNENKIEDYLDGNLTEKESSDFEQVIEKNAPLAKKLAVVNEVNQTISQEAKLQAFKKQLDSLSKDYFSEEETN
jgi:hypothetical protein